MSETRHVNKYKHRYGGTTTAKIRSSPDHHLGHPVNQIVDKVIRHWHEHTLGKDGSFCRAAARELATMFAVAAEDKQPKA